MKLRMLGSEELARNWYRIVDEVDRALFHGSGSVTSHGLFLQCLAAHAQCWVHEDDHGTYKAIGITRFEHQESTKMLAVTVTSGQGWFDYGPASLEILEEFARSSGCKKTIIYGRTGWKRILKDVGYKEPYITLTKEL